MAKLDDIAQDSTKLRYEASNTPSVLFRTLLFDLRLGATELNRLITNYLDDDANGIPPNGNVRSSERGNIIKALAGEAMSWKTFMKALQILSPVEMELNLKLTWKNGRVTSHTTRSILRNETLAQAKLRKNTDDAITVEA